jgi:hypothetical protein
MKKIKKSIAVVAALLLISSGTNLKAGTNNLEEAPSCSERAQIYANNYCCNQYGEDYTTQQFALVYAVAYAAMGCGIQ